MKKWNAKMKQWHTVWQLAGKNEKLAGTLAGKPRWHAITLAHSPRWYAGTYDTRFSKLVKHLWENFIPKQLTANSKLFSPKHPCFPVVYETEVENGTFLWINMLYTKISQILCRLRKSMLMSLKMSSLLLKLRVSELYY